MRRPPPVALVIALASLGACRSSQRASSTTDASDADAAPSVSAPAAPVTSAPPEPSSRWRAEPLRARSKDGTVTLEATLHRAPRREVPLLVLIHRGAGARDEWDPLLARLAAERRVPDVLVPDLRGHGASTLREPQVGEETSWRTMSPRAWGELAGDVEALVVAALGELRGTPGIVVVGSDLGGTVAAELAAIDPRVRAIGLVSPVAEAHGHDLYRAFAQVRERPVLFAAAEGDPVSSDPMTTLARMAPAATARRWPGAAHDADRLGEAHPELWDELAAWIAGPAWGFAVAPPAPAAAAPAGSGAAPPARPEPAER